MATNLAIDGNLLDRALAIGGLKTKKDTVNLALEVIIGPIRHEIPPFSWSDFT
ncbi:MAG: type II toxin-antitoxin system VapB family antitoxin [Tannerellaceae bacterium]|nr:type II toxin-antitoxin system VapB family antitoxin [Tannerellaceae bacterium]